MLPEGTSGVFVVGHTGRQADGRCGMRYNASMAKKGIKIKDLAQSLGVTSRALIDRCRAEGIAVQNSVTKLDVAQERQVRTWYAGDDEPTGEGDNGHPDGAGRQGES